MLRVLALARKRAAGMAVLLAAATPALIATAGAAQLAAPAAFSTAAATANAAPQPYAEVNAVACPSPGACVAVGYYRTVAGFDHAARAPPATGNSSSPGTNAVATPEADADTHTDAFADPARPDADTLPGPATIAFRYPDADTATFAEDARAQPYLTGFPPGQEGRLRCAGRRDHRTPRQRAG